MEQAQKEIRSSVSVNMFELSCRKREEEGEGSGIRYKKGVLPLSFIRKFFFKTMEGEYDEKYVMLGHISPQNEQNSIIIFCFKEIKQVIYLYIYFFIFLYIFSYFFYSIFILRLTRECFFVCFQKFMLHSEIL